MMLTINTVSVCNHSTINAACSINKSDLPLFNITEKGKYHRDAIVTHLIFVISYRVNLHQLNEFTHFDWRHLIEKGCNLLQIDDYLTTLKLEILSRNLIYFFCLQSNNKRNIEYLFTWYRYY